MLRFFSGPGLGLEITSSAVRLGALAGGGGRPPSLLAAKTASLSAGVVNENFWSPNVKDPEGLASVLTTMFREAARFKTRRLGLSLPDSVFRVQMFEFDELPSRSSDSDRLIRWRIEKGAAFDTSKTVLRYQALPKPDKGFFVLACLAKQEVLSQYENLITGAGYEPWVVAPSSFHTLNFYFPYISAKNVSGFALTWVAEGSYATIVVERGGPRFYRFKEIKPGAPEEVKDRLIREIDDSLHFYMHMDRQQSSAVGHLYLAGDGAILAPLADGLKSMTSLEIETLTPAVIVSSGVPSGGETLAAALGAGGAL